MKTPQEQLIEVQQAISDVLANAQEAWYNGQKVRKADLAVLQARENNLLAQIRRKNRNGGRGGIRVRGITPQ